MEMDLLIGRIFAKAPHVPRLGSTGIRRLRPVVFQYSDAFIHQ